MQSPVHELITAVTGAAIFALLSWFWTNVLPRIMQKFYWNELNIGDKWITTFHEEGKKYTENVTLNQKGRKVNGKITLIEENEDRTVYKFEGKFKYRILTCTYESMDPENYERGAFALEYSKGKSNKAAFNGQYILFSTESANLISSAYRWIRN